jgi:hypothetical protein
MSTLDVIATPTIILTTKLHCCCRRCAKRARSFAIVKSTTSSNIEQPLHCAERNDDRGGNKQLCWMAAILNKALSSPTTRPGR